MKAPAERLSIPTLQRLMSVRSESAGRFAVRFPAYEHVKFVALLRGRFDLQIEGDMASSRLRRGDSYVLTDGRPYRIFNADIATQDAAALYSGRTADGVVRWGEGPIDTVTIGARATFCPSDAERLRDALPPLVRIPAEVAEADRFRALLTLLCSEVEGAPGATFAADRYVGLLLVEASRYFLRNG